jgi:hypothetical protein
MSDEKPARRRDDDGRWQTAHSWDSLIERQIREAMQDGQFDNLPHQGAPLPNDENPHAGEWGLAFKMLKDAGYAPPWIEADKEVRELLARRDALFARVRANRPAPPAQRRDRELVERLVRNANAAITRLNSEAPGTRQHRRPLVLAEELAAYEEACGS